MHNVQEAPLPTSVPTSREFLALERRVAALEAGPPGTPEHPIVIPPWEPPDIDPPDPPAAGQLRATVLLEGQSFEFNEAAASTIGDYHDPAGRFTMTCHRLMLDGCDIRVDFRRIEGWSCIVFERSDGLIATAPVNLPAHVVVIVDDAGGSHSIELPAHYWAARWRWQSGPWPIPLASVDDLEEANLLPRLDPAVNRGTARPLGVPSYTPMSTAGLTGEMPATGGRADIGIVTDWQGEYLCTRSAEMLAGIIAQGEGGATFPWFFHDPAKGRQMDLMNDWKYKTCYWNNQPDNYINRAAVPGITIDVSHMPACAYLPFVLTGDPYFLETQQAMANYAFLDTPRSWEWVYQMPGTGQTRAMAWDLRTIMQAAAVTPDEVPSWLLGKSVMRQMLAQCVKGLDAIMHDGNAHRAGLHSIDWGLPSDPDPPGCWSRPWQTSFFAQAAGWGAMLHPELRAVAGYIAHNMIARADGKDWDASFPAPYSLMLRSSQADGAWYGDWDECWAATAPSLGVSPTAPFTNQMTTFPDYHGGFYAGLCALAHARAAGVEEIPGEVFAVLERYAGQMTALLDQGGDKFLTWNNSYSR
jgi:hypothetical protein